VLSDEDLAAESLLLTDAFTDELFAFPSATMVRFPISRLLVDVERFHDDADEPMSEVGMGTIYALTSSGKQLRRTLGPHERSSLISQFYEAHYGALSKAVGEELRRHGKALIFDCHSFPSQPLACDRDKSVPRPDCCIGTDPFHTSGELR